jgi:hypothetical protein
MTKKIYLCTECKKRIDNVQDVLFVEDVSNRGFCSETCIINFYRHYMNIFEQEELEFRQMLGLAADEAIDFGADENETYQQVLYAPTEVWLETSELKEEYYTHILKLDIQGTVYCIFVCSYFDAGPSFIFHKCFTRNEELVNKYRSGSRYTGKVSVLDDEEIEEFEGELELPPEVMEEVERKKSEYLAELLAARSPSDIEFEEFPSYEQYLPMTLEDPDEIYEREDNSEENLSTYIKSFQQGGMGFYYVVLCWKCDLKGVDGDVLIPVLSFPSVDNELYKEYALGNRTKGQVKN